MIRFSLAIWLLLLLAFPLGAQVTGDATPETSQTDATAEPQDENEEEETEIDDSDLDEQTYEEDDDDFIPTEEIPADEPIAFPSNI